MPTLAEILALPVVVAGRPIVVSGQHKLGTPIRWVHVASPATVRLLLGGELLLSTGEGWPVGRQSLRTFAQQFAKVGIAGLILELGTHYSELPSDLIDAFQDFDIPLIALRTEVRFVSITEAAHSLILDAQTGALRERDRIHGLFAALNRRRCSTEFLLKQVSDMLKKSVVLEDLNHRVIGWHALGGTSDAFLSGWARESRKSILHAVERPEPYPSTSHWREGGWLRTPVEARGLRWGTLIALDCSDVPQVAEVILESGAMALSLARLSDREDTDWAGLSQRRLLSDLLSGFFVEPDDLIASFEATGFSVMGRRMVAAVRRGESGSTAVVLQRLRGEAASTGIDVIAAPWSEEPQTTVLCVMSFNASRKDFNDVIVKLLAPHGDGELGPAIVAVGGVATTISELLASTDDAVSLLLSSSAPAGRGAVIQKSRAAALDILVKRRRTDPAVQNYAERMLGPLLRYEAEHGVDLLPIVETLVRHPTNRAKAAAVSHFSRSGFYERLRLIEELLDLQLDDGNNLAALRVAMLALGQPKPPRV